MKGTQELSVRDMIPGNQQGGTGQTCKDVWIRDFCHLQMEEENGSSRTHHH
jgi:hypothetical protein